MSHVETASSAGGDQSDLEIRVNTLQEDLSRRMKTAARLKKEQKSARRERLKVIAIPVVEFLREGYKIRIVFC